MQDPVAIGAQRDALFDLSVDGPPLVVCRQAVYGLLGAISHNVVEVDDGRVACAAVVAVLDGLELDPFLPRELLVSRYTGLHGVLVTLVVGLLVQAVLGLFFGLVFVRHDASPRNRTEGYFCTAEICGARKIGTRTARGFYCLDNLIAYCSDRVKRHTFRGPRSSHVAWDPG